MALTANHFSLSCHSLPHRICCLLYSKSMILIVFDFDHTVVDGNTDVKILDVLGTNKGNVKYDPKIGWTKHMKTIFLECSKYGVAKEDMVSVLKELKLTDGMQSLFDVIRKFKTMIKVVIASDSNAWFIDVLLDHYKIKDLIDEVHTNPAVWNGNLLEISQYETNTDCSRCPVNMCKSRILRNVLSDDCLKVLYIGDGSNDLSPVIHLKDKDIACPREGYRLCKLLENSEDVKCQILQWKNAQTIVECLVPHLE